MQAGVGIDDKCVKSRLASSEPYKVWVLMTFAVKHVHLRHAHNGMDCPSLLCTSSEQCVYKPMACSLLSLGCDDKWASRSWLLDLCVVSNRYFLRGGLLYVLCSAALYRLKLSAITHYLCCLKVMLMHDVHL